MEETEAASFHPKASTMMWFWDQHLDTKEISLRVNVPEYVIERVVHVELYIRRTKKDLNK